MCDDGTAWPAFAWPVRPSSQRFSARLSLAWLEQPRLWLERHWRARACRAAWEQPWLAPGQEPRPPEPYRERVARPPWPISVSVPASWEHALLALVGRLLSSRLVPGAAEAAAEAAPAASMA